MDDKLTAKTAKFTSLENLYVYGKLYVSLYTRNIYKVQYVLKFGYLEIYYDVVVWTVISMITEISTVLRRSQINLKLV